MWTFFLCTTSCKVCPSMFTSPYDFFFDEDGNKYVPSPYEIWPPSLFGRKSYCLFLKLTSDSGSNFQSSTSRCGTLKNPHCSIAMSAEHWLKFAALHQQWWRLNMSEKISVGRKPQTNKTRLKNSRVGWKKKPSKQNKIEKI